MQATRTESTGNDANRRERAGTMADAIPPTSHDRMTKDPNPSRPSFAERFAELLSSLGITQKALAERAGIAPATLSAWLSGPSEPRASDLAAMADAFGCTIDYLVGRSPWRTGLPVSYWVLDKDREDLIRAGRTPPDGGRFAWPIPDRYEILSSAQLEQRERELFARPRRKATSKERDGEERERKA